jgi:predicted DNA-binding transcriptional regulator AlpA
LEGPVGWKEEEIGLLLQKQVSKASIAKIVGVTRPTIYRFNKARTIFWSEVRLASGASSPRIFYQSTTRSGQGAPWTVS